MKYIIMCGGQYNEWKIPKHLLEINGESLVARTIRLLKNNGITDIAISTNDKRFEVLGVPLLHHYNPFTTTSGVGNWVDAFYPMNEPCCYLFGDVYYSPQAIKIIVETEVGDVKYFASSPPFSEYFMKEWAEPFAFKVVNQKYFKECIHKVKELKAKGYFYREPIAWELWQVIKGTPINTIDYNNYTTINDYTCDIDTPEDMYKLEEVLAQVKQHEEQYKRDLSRICGL